MDKRFENGDGGLSRGRYRIFNVDGGGRTMLNKHFSERPVSNFRKKRRFPLPLAMPWRKMVD